MRQSAALLALSWLFAPSVSAIPTDLVTDVILEKRVQVCNADIEFRYPASGSDLYIDKCFHYSINGWKFHIARNGLGLLPELLRLKYRLCHRDGVPTATITPVLPIIIVTNGHNNDYYYYNGLHSYNRHCQQWPTDISRSYIYGREREEILGRMRHIILHQ